MGGTPFVGLGRGDTGWYLTRIRRYSLIRILIFRMLFLFQKQELDENRSRLEAEHKALKNYEAKVPNNCSFQNSFKAFIVNVFYRKCRGDIKDFFGKCIHEVL